VGPDAGIEEVLGLVDSGRARDALRDWARSQEITLLPTGWSAAGFTSAQVLGVYVHEAGKHPRIVVLKINPRGDRSTDERRIHHQACRESRQFAKDHLMDTPFEPLRLDGGGWIMFQRVAGGGFDELGGFIAMLANHDEPATTCKLIVHSLLTEWNTDPEPRPTLAGPLLSELLDERTASGGTLEAWAGRHAGLLHEARCWLRHGDLDLANPFALAAGKFGNDTGITAIRGKIHGDLHPDNLLISKTPSTPVAYRLVDLSRYRNDGVLAWDPAYLMLTTAATYLSDIHDAHLRVKLREALLDPSTVPEGVPRELRYAIKGITHGEVDHARSHDMIGMWRKQRLVCLVAIGLILSGRTLLQPSIREWFFWLAAHAATKLLGSHGARDPLRLPDPLIHTDATSNPVPAGVRQAPLPRQVDHAGGRLLDRENDRRDLHTRLTAGPWGIIVVSGPPGVGKSALVDAVLKDVEGREGHRIYRHEAVPGIPLDIRTLIDDLTGDGASSGSAGPGKTSLARLESVLGAHQQTAVTIVIECAENLVHRTTNELVDLDLDEAFELLATDPAHRVAVVLVTHADLRSPQGGVWPDAQPTIGVRGLPYEHFVSYLDRLEAGAPTGLATLPADVQARLHRALRGNPHLADLARATLTLTDSGFDARTLAEHLAGLPTKDVPRRLADLLAAGLSTVRQRVLDALAAYATPVDAAAVAALLAEEMPATQVRGALARLAAERIIRSAPPDRYYLPPSDVEQIVNERLDRATDHLSRSRFLRRAADELRSRRAVELHGVDDLRIHFAELMALRRARRYSSAYRMIEAIDGALREWNCGHLLLEHREAVQGQLADNHLEMANDNELGELYAASRQSPKAIDAFRRALKVADEREDHGSRTKLRANLAAMYWQEGDTDFAYNYYDLAREDAVRYGVPVVLMGALEGLADCHRRWGRYDEAFRCGNEALMVPAMPGYPDTADAQNFASSRTVRLTLKLARWHGELGRAAAAARSIEAAERAAVQRGDQWLRAACLDGRAELLLGQGQVDASVTTAIDAIEHALRLHDPITLLQARTTLCVALLRRDDSSAAGDEIERAKRYRNPGRSLIVLALLALGARQRGDTAKADQRFRQLQEQATNRLQRDGRDFGAWDFKGLAICGSHPDDARLDEAVAAFRTARGLTPPTPGLTERLTFLLLQLDKLEHRPGRLRVAIDAIASTEPGQR
jgi:tetratricopeptide (TPR) repeat protein